MSAAKHTPGPWRVKEYTLFGGDKIVGGVIGQDGENIRVTGLTLSSGPDCEANARLIAAAPELLDACEEALGCLNGAEIALPGYVVAALERAIAKATGEQS